MEKRNIKNIQSNRSFIPNFYNNRFKYLLLILAFILLGVLYVMVRMQSIEQDYAINEIAKKYQEKLIENKELKATKASMLSITQLEIFAKKHKLLEPSEKNIIIISEN
jgi:hypothetical protein